MRFNALTAFRLTLITLTAALGSVTTAGDEVLSHMIVRQHDSKAGQAWVLALRPDVKTTAVRQHLLLIDTSASQIGIVREATLAAVDQTLKQLPSDSKVSIYAVDVTTVALTEGFVAPQSKAAQSALGELKMRTPLGTTNLVSALDQLRTLTSQTSVLYIGDGLSANRLNADDLATRATDLRRAQVSIHSLVIGPRTSTRLPSALANLTGGTVRSLPVGNEPLDPALVESLGQAAVTVNSLKVDGRLLATHQPILLRPDRHTVIARHGILKPANQVVVTLKNGRTLTWNGAEATRLPGGAELVHLARTMKESRGIDAPVTNIAQLNAMARDLKRAVAESVQQARFLSRSGKPAGARRVLKDAAQMDRSDAKVQHLLTALSISQDEDNPGNDQFGGGQGADTDPLQDVADRVRLQGQILVAETNATIDAANRRAAEDPDFAINQLKGILETIKASGDIAPNVRAELQRRVAAAIADVNSRVEINALRAKQIARDEAVREAHERLLQEDVESEELLEIQIEKVRGLLERGRHGDINAYEDAELQSRITLDQKPGNGPATQALVMSEALGQLDKAYRLVNLRHDRFLEVLYQVELSHVPFPDEPPILYPPADVWRALTLTRRPKYESFDLRTEAPVEKWLHQMLDKPVRNLDFPGSTPLLDILNQIETYFTQTYGAGVGASGTDFKMTIYPDRAELQLNGIEDLGTDVTIDDINLNGQSLRTALKLIFEQTESDQNSPAPLTYIIQDEVMKITTVEKANSVANLVTRVYPVADLAIAPNAHQQLGGGGFGGGGFGGQQGGGFGGGFQSIPAEDVKKKP